VPGLFDRLLGLAQAYHAQRPAAESADLTVLALRGMFECVSNSYEKLLDQSQAAAVAEYNRAGGTVDADEDEDGTDDDDTGNGGNVRNDAADANDTNDAKRKKALRNFERRIARADWATDHPTDPDPTASASPAFPPSFAFTSPQVVAAMRRLAPDLDPDLPLDSLTPNLVGRLLRQLRLKPHRTASLRVWATTAVGLARLARAYGVPIPPHLAEHFAAAQSSSSTSPP
jgi:hypothetical protein